MQEKGDAHQLESAVYRVCVRSTSRNSVEGGLVTGYQGIGMMCTNTEK